MHPPTACRIAFNASGAARRHGGVDISAHGQRAYRHPVSRGSRLKIITIRSD
jgi:hypothetical protein